MRPVIKWAFGRLRRKPASRGREEDTRVWYRETMFSQMVSYDFLLHEPLHGYFFYLVCAPPEKPTKRCEPEEGYLRCSKRFDRDHGSHSIIFLLFEFKSVRWCWRWETQRNVRVAFKPTRRSHSVHTKRWLWASRLERRDRFVNSKRELLIEVVHEQLRSPIYEQGISPVDDTMAEDLIVSLRSQWSEQPSCRWMALRTSMSKGRDNFAILEDWLFL